MRVALMIEGQEGVSWEQWLALAAAAEEAGIEALFRSDHYLSLEAPGERASLDAWTTLAGLAARTSRIRLGTLVSPATFRHPSVLAKAVATVDHISGGRVELGLGAGWMELEHRAYGFDFPPTSERVARFAEQLEIVHRVWTEEATTFRGRFYELEECPGLPKPLQRPRPPIIVGGSAHPGTTRPAARFADEYNTFSVSPDEARRRRRRLDEACEAEGRDPATLPLSVMAGFLIGSDEGELRERARRLAGDGADELLARYDDSGVAGTPTEIVERFRAYEDAGVVRVMLQHLLHDDLDSVELVGREVLPALAS
jgi:F420-dependent oxidoreductase-like protein